MLAGQAYIILMNQPIASKQGPNNNGPWAHQNYLIPAYYHRLTALGLSLWLCLISLLWASETKAQTNFLAHSRWVQLSDSLFNLKKSEEALALLLAERTRLVVKNDTVGQDFLVISYALGRHYYNRYDYPNALPHFEKALALQEHINPSHFANLADILSWKGVSVKRIIPQHAIPILEKALELNIKAFGENSLETAFSYNDLGTLYGFVLEDFEKGEAYYAKAVRVLKDAGLQNKGEYIEFQANIALLQSSEGRYDDAIKKQLELLPLMQQKHGMSVKLGKLLIMIGENYAQMGHFREALKYQYDAVDMLTKTDTVNKTMLGAALGYVGVSYNQYKKPDSALIFLEKIYKIAKEMSKEKWKGPGSWLSWHFATSYGLLQKPDKALAYLDTAFVDEGYRMGMPFDSIRQPNFISMLLMEKNKHLIQKYDQNKDKSTLEEAKKALSLALDINANLVGNFQNARSKLAAYRELYRGASLANQTLLSFYDLTANPKYLQEAFTTSETSKSLLLYQQIMEQKSRRKAKVPLTLVQREQLLQNKIVQLEKQVFETQQSSKSNETAMLKEEIFSLQKQYELLKSEITKDFPDYFLAHAPLPRIEVKTVQSSLSDHEALLEFFTGDSTITIFLLRSDTLIHRITRKKEVEAKVKQFREAVNGYFLSETKNSALYLRTANEYVEAAYWLYQTLIAPLQTQLPENLTIIPDGTLAYLPFEALLSARPERPDRFHTHAYWNQKHILHYSYSATLLREMDEKQLPEASQSLLAMAPFYDNSTSWHDSLTRQLADQNRADFTPLPFSGEEVYHVAQLTHGKAMAGKLATKKAFMDEAGQYRILHLATHARANDRAGDYSYINFAPSAEYPQGERLYVSEIYGLGLHADLVTLSACETGLGKMHRGEGVVSIARAFVSAGAHSILQSLWTVSDAKTRHLMIYFYQNLNKGLAKDEAMHLAKKDYVQKFKGEEAHPYFWAGFVLVGR